MIFSTRDRLPYIADGVIKGLHAYLAQIAREHNCDCFRVGGVADHVHLAVRLSRTISISKLIEELKKGSSKWMKTQGSDLGSFSWQRGYGCFSLSPKDLDKLITYIANQKQHHETKDFKEEFREFLEKYGVEYDERYVWD